jgi:hypothetical protein
MSRTSASRALSVKVDRTHVVVDEWGRDRRAGRLRHRRPCRATMACAQGEPRRRRSASRRSRASRACIRSIRPRIPGCTYCQPQVASVGLTEACKAKGREVEGRSLPLSSATARRSRWAKPEGLVKTGLRRQDRRASGRAHDRAPR